MSALISTDTQKEKVTTPKTDKGEVVIKPLTRKVSEVAGILSKYKKSQPVSVEEMDQAISSHLP